MAQNRNIQKAKKGPPSTPGGGQAWENCEDVNTDSTITAQPRVSPRNTRTATSANSTTTASNSPAECTSTDPTYTDVAVDEEEDEEEDFVMDNKYEPYELYELYEPERGRDSDEEENQQTPAKRRRKTPRPPVVLSEEKMLEMAEFLKQNDCLYNRSRDLWKDTQARARLWHQQGQAMNRTGMELQQWYESLRTKLGRIKKKTQRSGGGVEVLTDANRRLLQIFDFITPHMYGVRRKNKTSEHVDSRGPASHEDREEGPEGWVEPEFQADNQEESPTNHQTSDGTIKYNTPFHRSNGDEALRRSSRLQQKTDLLHQLIKNQQNNSELMTLSTQVLRSLDRPQAQHPDREQFAKYIGSVLQKLPNDLYRKANRVMSDLLMDLQDEASDRR